MTNIPLIKIEEPPPSTICHRATDPVEMLRRFADLAERERAGANVAADMRVLEMDVREFLRWKGSTR